MAKRTSTDSIKPLVNAILFFYKLPVFCFLVGAFLGITLFISLFGLGALNPTNIQWIQNINGDMNQHYIGWLYFRETAWHFPNIGQIDELAYPTGISLVYMDVIPLFAIIFKLFSGILPDQFQYFGFFTVLSFALFGGYAMLISRRFTKRTILALLGGMLIICTPIIIGRAFGHTALTAHWLILCALYYVIVFYQEHRTSFKKQLVVWTTLLSLAVLTHAYFIPMVGSIMLFSIILQHRSYRTSILLFILPITISLIIFGAIGGFSKGVVTNGDSGLGLYATNVLAPIIPMGYSNFLGSIFTHVQWEGLAYLGLGALSLLPIIFYTHLQRIKEQRPSKVFRTLWYWLRNARVVSLSALVCIIAIIAFSPYIYIGDTVLIHIQTPEAVKQLWETFRSTGRLFWPIYYAALAIIIARVFRETRLWKTWTVVILLSPIVLLQAFDILRSPAVTAKSNDIHAAITTPHITNHLNSQLIERNCSKDEVILLDNTIEAGIDMFRDLSDYIIFCHPKLTTGYFARFPKKAIIDYANDKRSGLIKGTLSIPSSSLYLLKDSHFLEMINHNKYQYSQVGKYYVIKNK